MISGAYEKALVKAFRKLHGCEAAHLESVPVIETRQGKTVWEGEIELFELIDHPKSSRGYAWASEKARGNKIVAVLELPPDISPKPYLRRIKSRPGES